MIEVEGLRKSYGKQVVLDGLNFQVEDGEVFGFVGPNGAGKSTFLKCALGIAFADAGSVRVGHAGDVADVRQDAVGVRSRIGYSPGETSIYQSLRAETFLQFALAHYRNADLDWARSLAGQFGLPLRKRIKGFSHGMKRKLLLAQAIASKAAVLMLDEPMEGLDPEARRTVEQILVHEAGQGRTVFFSSHDLASVERICDRVAFLRGGNLLEIGRVQEILARAGRTLHLRLREARQQHELPQRDGWKWDGEGTRWRLQFADSLETALPDLRELPIQGIRDGSGRLEDVFDSLYGPDPTAASAAGGTK